ncbi:MAG TPA: glycosyltransferase [Steroidobacteraceae bacterium]|jgi:glycosyltransferase involved in cell wall biosynthesis|nr:glycosyltransferase [Steroidobacteraceae bacterium]
MTNISVVMASFNAVKYIDAAVRSAMSQLDSSDELVIQDAGSTDGTIEHLTRIASQDARVKFISEPDAGQSDGLNRAIARSKGEYLIWLNADDLLLPGAVAALKSAVSSTARQPDLVYGGHKIVAADGTLIASYGPRMLKKSRLLLKGCYIFSGAMLMSRAALLEVGALSDDLHFCMDYDLIFRLHAGARLTTVVSVPIGALRWHDESKSGTSRAKFLAEARKVRLSNVDSVGYRILAVAGQALFHLSYATTPLRQSAIYGRIRGRSR